ncbi:trypsin-like serine protease [Oligoflexus tunisiensis]|uniref:trypsin-like serine protease n=1 Tax=Oligoflexus tunisiensis TaxID=708132 RepID=UPI000A4B7F19|nr:trypsin-like serine protease [Oligoflexus tunisiensis]
MRTTFTRPLLVLTLGIGWIGSSCQPVRTSSNLKVVNGQSVADGSPVRASTVGLVSLKPDGSRDQIFCSGVIIAPDAVLTATQCLDSAADAGVKFAVLLDHPKLATPRTAAVKSSQNFSPAGSRDYPSLNLSVLRLASPIDPAIGYQAAEILRSPDSLQPSTEVLIAGYGRQNSKCLDTTRCSGVLLEAKSTVASFQDQNHLLSTLLVQAKQDQGSVCFGDAGGPAFVQVGSRYFLAGIASGSLRRGLSELSAVKNDEFRCENGLAAFTFPGDYLGWMDRNLGLKFSEPSADNLPRASLPALENPVQFSKPTNPFSWVDWLAFSDYQDPAFGTVSYLQQKLLNTESGRRDAARINELDLYLRPQEAAQRAQTVTELVLKPEGKAQPLSNIEPLTAFSNLSKLELDSLPITDFAPLGRLVSLNSLRITGHVSAQSVKPSLPKLEGLSNLTRLQTLELDRVGTETLRGVNASKLVALRSLTLVGNGQPIFIPKAPALDTLIISNVDFTNPDQLVGLPASLTTLKITGSKLGSAAFVSTLVNLKTLDLSGNLIQDFSKVADLKRLNTVRAVGNPATSKVCGTPAAAVCEYDQITNPVTLDEYCINFVFQPTGRPYAAAIEALSKAATLPATPSTSADCAELHSKLRLKRKLELIGTPVPGAAVDISPVAAIRSLNNLTIRNFGLIDVAPLARLINMDKLDLSDNLILDPKPLEVLPELAELDLSRNMIVDMLNFSHPKLKRLTLDGNRMVSAQSFGALPELRALSLAEMPGFRDLSGLDKMGKLKNLNVDDTNVTDLKTLEPSVGLAIEAPEAAVKNGCPVLLGSCVSDDGVVETAQAGPVPGLKPGRRVQVNPTSEVHLPGLNLSVKLE